MTKFFYVKSFTDSSKGYIVRLLDNGEWRCECPHFTLRQSSVDNCKHIRKAIRELINDVKKRQKDEGMGQREKETQKRV